MKMLIAILLLFCCFSVSGCKPQVVYITVPDTRVAPTPASVASLRADPPVQKKPSVKVEGPDIKTDWDGTVSWKVRLLNNSSISAVGKLEIKAFDSQGYLLARDFTYSVEVSPNDETKLAGSFFMAKDKITQAIKYGAVFHVEP